MSSVISCHENIILDRGRLGLNQVLVLDLVSNFRGRVTDVILVSAPVLWNWIWEFEEHNILLVLVAKTNIFKYIV